MIRARIQSSDLPVTVRLFLALIFGVGVGLIVAPDTLSLLMIRWSQSVHPETVSPVDAMPMVEQTHLTSGGNPSDARVLPLAPTGATLLMHTEGPGGRLLSYVPRPGVYISSERWAQRLVATGWTPAAAVPDWAVEGGLRFFSRHGRHCSIFVDSGIDREQLAILWLE